MWKTISSAPKDRPILVSDGETMTTVQWYNFGDIKRKVSGYWKLLEPGSYAEDSMYYPMYWMELPELPKRDT